MARTQPLYTTEEQYALLGQEIPSVYIAINTIRFRLLVACSSGGTLESAKNRFLFLIHDTELSSIFSSIYEIPEVRLYDGSANIQNISKKFRPNYSLISMALSELRQLGIPRSTIDLLENYFEANQDPVYKLSVMATVVMLSYAKDDEINNRKD